MPVTLSEPQSPHVRGVEATLQMLWTLEPAVQAPQTPESSNPAPGVCRRAGAPAPSDLTRSRPWARWTGGTARHRDRAPRDPWLCADAFKMEQRTRLVTALSCLVRGAVVVELREGPWAGPLIRRVPDMVVASLVLAAAASQSPWSPRPPDADASRPSRRFLNPLCSQRRLRECAIYNCA